MAYFAFSVTADALENSMVIGPRQEASLFANRDKFDLVAVYDESSTSFASDNSPLSVLVRVTYEQAFRKMLRRMPIMLVGGIAAWKRDLKETELVRGSSFVEAQIQKPTPTRTTPSALLLNGTGNASYANGHITANGYANGNGVASNPASGAQHEVWAPRKQEYVSTGDSAAYGEHQPTMSFDQTAHIRFVVCLPVAALKVLTQSPSQKPCRSRIQWGVPHKRRQILNTSPGYHASQLRLYFLH